MSILMITLSMTVLILLLLLFERIIGRKFSAKCRYILWALLLLRLAVPVSIPLFTVDIPEAEEPTPPVPWNDTTPMGEPVVLPMPSEPLSVIIPEDIAVTSPEINVTVNIENTPEPTITVHRQINFHAIWDRFTDFLASRTAVCIWLTGAVLFALWKIIGHTIYIASLKRSLQLADSETYELFSKLKEKYRIANPPALYLSDKVESPLLFGYLHPCILLPTHVAGKDFASSNAAVVILSHELTHCRRGDLWVKLICLAARAFHWFNPFVHLAANRCTQAMELSCDEAVLAGYDEDVRRNYGKVMLDIVKRCRNRGEVLTTHFNPKKSAVKERFANILDAGKKRKGIVIIAIVLLLCAVGCTITMNRDTETDEPNTNDTFESAEGTANTLSLAEKEALLAEQKRLEAERDAILSEQERLEAERAELLAKLKDLESELSYVQSESDILNRREVYRMWIEGAMSTEDLIINHDYVREDMANSINQILQALRDGKNPFDIMPGPPTSDAPVLPFDATLLPYISAEYLSTLRYTVVEETTENGNCGQKFTLAVPNGQFYPEYYIDLFWDIAWFGESVEMYINHMEIYHIDDRMEEVRQRTLATDDTIASLNSGKRMSAWPYIEFWVFLGTAKNGQFVMYYTKDLGATVTPVDTTIPDHTFDKAVPIGIWPREDNENTTIIVELTTGDEVEYVGFNHFRGDPFTFTYRGPLSAEDILSARSYFPINNISKNLLFAHQMEDLPELKKCLPAVDWDHRIDYIQAFLTKDVAALTEICTPPDPEMYEDYAYISVTEWYVWLDASHGPGNEMVYFSFRSPESPIDGFSEDEMNTFIVQEGLYGIYLRSLTEEVLPTEESAKMVAAFLNNMYFEAIPTSNDMPEHHRWSLTDYIIARLCEKTGKLFVTAEEIRDFAAFLLNIPDFTPSNTHRADYYLENPESVENHLGYSPYENNLSEMKAGNIYTGVAHGGIFHAFRIVGIRENDTKAYVDVQFYADASMTIKSHLYSYVMKKVDGEWTILRSVLEREAKYPPFCVGT